ncbi:MAG: amino acid ABC transporter permease [Actinomycetia bacterium]|nr:amino acid ABC transporter permease [Actinomycetes bacterium]
MDIVRVFREATPMLLQGIWMTFLLTIVSVSIAMVLGLLSSLMGMSAIKPLQWISGAYIKIIRGTPLIVQAFFIYFGLPQLIQSFGVDFRFSAFVGGAVTLCLNAGAYLSEIFRGGIQAVDPGQMEAARSLGLTKGRAMYKIVLPQALRIITPSLVNQIIISLKDTSIISVIAFPEIVYQAKIYMGRTMQSFATWTVVALFYLVLITLLATLSRRIEKRMSNAA